MEFLTAFWDALTTELFRALGSLFGTILQALLYVLFAYLFWGVLWDRILTKAGYKGKDFQWRFWLLCSPVLVAPLYKVLPYTAYEWLMGISSLGCYLALVALAIMPWNKPEKKEPPKKQLP